MPTYRYICPKCGAEKTEVKLMRDCDEPVYCECGEKMNRQFGVATFKIRGASSKNNFVGELYKNDLGSVTGK
jgi:putative FmdB family regulatory protein